MSHFWQFAPEGYKGGSDLFGPAHLISVAILVAITVVLCVLICRSSKKEKIVDVYLKVVSIFLIAFELFKLGFEAFWTIKGVNPEFRWQGQLSLYTCSIALYVLPFIAFSKNDKIKSFCYSWFNAIGIFAGLTNLVYLSILGSRPFWHFSTIHSLIYHWLMVQTGILMIVTGRSKVSWLDIPRALVPNAIVCVPAIIVNALADKKGLHADYMMLNYGEGMPIIGPMAQAGHENGTLWLYILFMLVIGYGIVAALFTSIFKGIGALKSKHSKAK